MWIQTQTWVWSFSNMKLRFANQTLGWPFHMISCFKACQYCKMYSANALPNNNLNNLNWGGRLWHVIIFKVDFLDGERYASVFYISALLNEDDLCPNYMSTHANSSSHSDKHHYATVHLSRIFLNKQLNAGKRGDQMASKISFSPYSD